MALPDWTETQETLCELAHTLSPQPPRGLLTQWKKGKKINENGSGMELWMAHDQMLTNTNAPLAGNTERLRSQPAAVICAHFLFLTWRNTQHGAVVTFFFSFQTAIAQEKIFNDK